jgi:hypothetical protein
MVVLLFPSFVWVVLVDQTAARPVAWFIRTRRFPSLLEILSSNEVASLMGLSRFATHAGVNLETLLNHMPRYQEELALLVFWDELLPVPASKKPSAYLPFLDTSLSPIESAWSPEMVSLVVVVGGGGGGAQLIAGM